MIIDHQDLPEIRHQLAGETIALRCSCYDLLHIRHLESLEFASEQAEVLVIGVSPDERVRERKGPGRPIQRQEVRLANVNEVDLVDYSFLLPATPVAVFRSLVSLRPDSFVEAAEYNNAPHGGRTLLRIMGIEYTIDRGQKVQSTSALVERLRNADTTV